MGKVNLLLAVNISLSRASKKGHEVNGWIEEFISYCTSTIFKFPVIPQIGEIVNIEDILDEWCKKNFKNDAEKKINILWHSFETELYVTMISHGRFYTTVECSDNY